ncbi:MAG: type IV secretion system DNA-binding domain-containing protein [Halobacteria archaeon]
MPTRSIRIDDGDDVLTMAFKAFVGLSFPFLAIGNGRHPVREFFGFRYMYLSWTAITFLWLRDFVLNGEPFYLLTAPFLHLVSALVLAVKVFSGKLLIGTWQPVFLFSVTYGAVVTEFLRRKMGLTISSITGIDLPSSPFWTGNDGTYEVPMDRIDEKPKDERFGRNPELSDDISTLFIGETGSGKSSGMMLIASQYPYEDNVATIVLDFGDDFKTLYDEYTDLETLKMRYTDSDVVWNLFADIEEEDDFIEITTSIFGEPSGRNPFHEPARQVFEDGLRYLYREAVRQDRLKDLGHGDVLDFFQKQGADEIARNLSSYNGFKGSVSHLEGERSEAPKRNGTYQEEPLRVLQG